MEIKGHLVVQGPSLGEEGEWTARCGGDVVGNEEEREQELFQWGGWKSSASGECGEPEDGGDPVDGHDPDDAVPSESCGCVWNGKLVVGLPHHDEAAKDEEPVKSKLAELLTRIHVDVLDEMEAGQGSEGVVKDNERRTDSTEDLEMNEELVWPIGGQGVCIGRWCGHRVR